MRFDKNYKTKILAKAFLCANKGKWYTAREINHFINSNFHMNGGVTATALSKMLNYEISKQSLEYLPVQRKKHYGHWKFAVL